MTPDEFAAQIREAVAVHPGDVLVISTDAELSQATVDEFLALFNESFPETIKTVLLGREFHLHVLRGSEVAP